MLVVKGSRMDQTGFVWVTRRESRRQCLFGLSKERRAAKAHSAVVLEDEDEGWGNGCCLVRPGTAYGRGSGSSRYSVLCIDDQSDVDETVRYYRLLLSFTIVARQSIAGTG